MKKHNGFTLIELMIVVAIVGVISAVAIPQYQNYVLKSNIAAAVAELAGGRSQYELIMNDGATSSVFTTDNIGFGDSQYCSYTIHQPNGSGESIPALECELKNVGVIAGESVFLNRRASGEWYCSTSAGIAPKYKPNGC